MAVRCTGWERTGVLGCIIQFWPPYDEHVCSKHVEAWNKLIIKFCASSWLITKTNNKTLLQRSVDRQLVALSAVLVSNVAEDWVVLGCNAASDGDDTSGDYFSVFRRITMPLSWGSSSPKRIFRGVLEPKDEGIMRQRRLAYTWFFNVLFL